MRADKLFEPGPTDISGGSYLSPFLRSIVLERGRFGVSHTRVPTESRPGHVALIAGFYEDVSAVMKGWKTNPVDFDSVFNQSRHTWSYGSPDILPMFAEGASDPSRVDQMSYSAEMEDFANVNGSELDTWVFDRVDELLANASQPEVRSQLDQPGSILFLHLLGLDTNGHAHRPYSREYLENIQLVDRGIQALEQKLNSFYHDGKTAYVFTADHGMSDFGSHGDGHPDNTRTPIIVWGAGIRKPDKAGLGHEDGVSSNWGLDAVSRVDIDQADIAPLMVRLNARVILIFASHIWSVSTIRSIQ